MRHDYLIRVQFFVSTKADLLTDKVNKWIDEMEEQHGDNFSISDKVEPVMSYTTIKDKGAYMIGCCVNYILFVDEEEEIK